MISKRNQYRIFFLRAAGALVCALFYFSVFPAGFASAMDAPSEKVFLVDKGYDFYGRTQVTSFLAYDSANAHIYYEKQYYDESDAQEKSLIMSRARALGDGFDSTIYPRTKEIFGDEWNPGIDNDEKINILLVRMNYGVGGYFNPSDEYAKTSPDSRSNESEMVYLNTDYLGQHRSEGFLGHELQHMIYWNEKTRIKKVNDDVWLNEGRSELASAIVESELGSKMADRTLVSRKHDFLINYEDSIVDWNNMSHDYASVSIFMQYLKDHLGTDIFRQLSNSRKTGIASLSYVLEQTKKVRLGDIFTSWTIANYLNDTDMNVMYGYDVDELKDSFNVKPEVIYDKDRDGDVNLSGDIKNWSARYYEIFLTDSKSDDLFLEIDFNGEDAGTFAATMVINYKDGTKKIDSIKLDGRQDGTRQIVSTDKGVTSIVFILSSQKIDEMLTNNQAQGHPITLDIKIDAIKDKMLPGGSLLRTAGQEKVYLLEDGKRRWVADSATFIANGFDWNDVIIVTEEELSIYPDGELLRRAAGTIPDDSLIQGSGPQVYLIESRKRRWIRDEKTFSSHGFRWDQIMRVSDQELFSYEEGEILSDQILADGMLIKGAGPQVYLLEGGKKRWITSPEAFTKNRFDWLSIVETSDDVVSSYIDGPDID